jgi:septation ring formation regulator EzrA
MGYHRVMDADTAKAFATLNKRFDEVDKKFDEVDKRFDEVDKRFDEVHKRFDRVETRLDRVETRLDGHDGRFEKLEADSMDLNVALIEEFRRIDRRFATMADEVAEKVSSQMQRYMEIVLERQSSDARAFNEKLSCQQARVDDHESRIGFLEHKSA